ncbi:MAG: hypothetical protein KDA92_08560 [Planctomycetales bacterium]|nr:hypothetical protein [Planctomycetales bacterium]MCA9167335.1 hypothetical protein [Planctomycetales bacterium]
MSFSTAMSVAATGIQQGFQKLDDAARRIAEPDSDDLAKDLVSAIEAKHSVAANAAVVKTSDKMVGSLVDMMV